LGFLLFNHIYEMVQLIRTIDSMNRMNQYDLMMIGELLGGPPIGKLLAQSAPVGLQLDYGYRGAFGGILLTVSVATGAVGFWAVTWGLGRRAGEGFSRHLAFIRWMLFLSLVSLAAAFASTFAAFTGQVDNTFLRGTITYANLIGIFCELPMVTLIEGAFLTAAAAAVQSRPLERGDISRGAIRSFRALLWLNVVVALIPAILSEGIRQNLAVAEPFAWELPRTWLAPALLLVASLLGPALAAVTIPFPMAVASGRAGIGEALRASIDYLRRNLVKHVILLASAATVLFALELAGALTVRNTDTEALIARTLVRDAFDILRLIVSVVFALTLLGFFIDRTPPLPAPAPGMSK
jgi:hypothetical protein